MPRCLQKVVTFNFFISNYGSAETGRKLRELHYQLIISTPFHPMLRLLSSFVLPSFQPTVAAPLSREGLPSGLDGYPIE
jgi:hypothetical protein